MIKSRADMDRFLAAQLKKLGTEQIDYYLVHALNGKLWDNVERLGVLDFLEQAKKDGRIVNAGFSFHGLADDFKRIVDAYPWVFCQIQYNYLDENNQAGTAGLEYAAAKGLGVIVMEPLRGGNLGFATPPPAVAAIWNEAKVRRTPAEWALRWVWNRPEVTVVLSGMNREEQVRENLSIASTAQANALTEGGTRTCRAGRPDLSGTDEGRLHRLRLLHALPFERDDSHLFRGIQHHAHVRRRGGNEVPLCPAAERGTGRRPAGLCLPVRPMRRVPGQVPAANPDPGYAGPSRRGDGGPRVGGAGGHRTADFQGRAKIAAGLEEAISPPAVEHRTAARRDRIEKSIDGLARGGGRAKLGLPSTSQGVAIMFGHLRSRFPGRRGFACCLSQPEPCRHRPQGNASDKGAPKLAEPITKGQRIACASHSFHVFMPDILNEMVGRQASRAMLRVVQSFIGGSTILQHWNVPDNGNQLKQVLRTGKVDVCLSCRFTLDEGIENFTKLAAEIQPRHRILVQEFWLRWDIYEPTTCLRERGSQRHYRRELRERHALYFKTWTIISGAE